MGLLVLCWEWLRLMPFCQCKFHVGFWQIWWKQSSPQEMFVAFSAERSRGQNTFQQSWKWRIGLYFRTSMLIFGHQPTVVMCSIHLLRDLAWVLYISFYDPLLCKRFLLLFIYIYICIYPNLSWRRYCGVCLMVLHIWGNDPIGSMRSSLLPHLVWGHVAFLLRCRQDQMICCNCGSNLCPARDWLSWS